MKLELHQGTDSHTFPTHLAGANGRTNEIAYRDEFPSLSYSANLSAVDADALLNTQLTVLGFPSVNYQQYLNFTLRLDSTSPHLFQRTLHDARAQTLELLSTLAHQVLPFKPCPGLRKLLKQERRRQLRSAAALPKALVRRETWQTRLETDRVHSRALSDSLRASCQTLPADFHCGKCIIFSSFSSTVRHRTARIHRLSSLALQYFHLAQLQPPRLPLQWHSTLAIEVFVGSVLRKLRIRGMSSLGLSHQWPQQRARSYRVLYVPGAWLCNIIIQFSASSEVLKNYPDLAATETFTLEVRICPVALLDHSRLAILPSLLVTTRVYFSSEALQLFFLRLLPICYSPGTAFLNFLGFWTRALIDELECPILSAGGFENFFDPLWDEVIARIGLTWQVAFESVASCSVPGITLPLHLSPTLFGKTPPTSLSDEQLWRTSGTLHLPLLFRPVDRVIIVVPPACLEASPPQPAPIGLSSWTRSSLRRGRRLRIFRLVFFGRSQDFSVVERWLTGHCPPTGFSCFVLHLLSVMHAFCLLEFEAGDIVAY